MSELKQKIQNDIKEAMKAREQHLLLTLRGLMAAIKQIEVDSRKEIDDAGVLAVLQKEMKKRRDTLKFAREQKRDDIVEQNEAEVAIIEKYLGAELDEEELKQIISDLVSGGADSIGAVMQALNADYKGRFDGKLASEITRSLL